MSTDKYANIYVFKRNGDLCRGNFHSSREECDSLYHSWYKDELAEGYGEPYASRLCTLSSDECGGMKTLANEAERPRYIQYLQKLEAEANGNQTTHDHDHGNDAGHGQQLLEFADSIASPEQR